MAVGTRYFKLIEDLDIPRRWYLGYPRTASGRQLEPDDFTCTTRVELAEPVEFSVKLAGTALDWSMGAFDVPVVSNSLRAVLERAASSDLQIIPVIVDDQEDEYAIVNVLSQLKCLDERESTCIKWRPEDGRPDRLGQYRQVSRLRINPVLVQDREMFRVWGWSVAIVVGEKLKRLFEDRELTGVRFEPVSD